MKYLSLRLARHAALVASFALTSALSVSTLTAASRTYTTNADFDEGTLFNVNHDIPDQLQLNTVATTFPIMWIANGGEDTVSKIDTNTGREVARYRTGFGPAGQPGHLNHLGNPWAGPAPSRTAVDAQGNVYVANRHFDGKQSTIVKILATGGIDRNGNSIIDTSADLNSDGVITNPSAEILPLGDTNGNGIVDPAEIRDERVAWSVRVGAVNGLARSLSIAPDGHLWVGLYSSAQYYKVSSVDGSILLGPVSVPNNPYGSLVDSAGTLYGAGLSSTMIKMNTVPPHSPQAFFHSGTNYGIALGNTRVYLALHNFGTNVVAVFNPGTNTFSYFSVPGIGGVLGISVDSTGHIFLSAGNVGPFGGSFRGATKLRPDGSIVWSQSAQSPATGGDQRGAIVDSNGDVWTVNRVNNSVSKFRGTNGAALGVFPVGDNPYTYSDASGSAFLQSNPSGNWTIVHDTGFTGTTDGTISWTATVPAPGAAFQVEARAANTLAALAAQTFVPVTNGGLVPGSIVGRYWEVRATFSGTAGQTLITPVLFDLTITTNQPPTVACPPAVTAQCPGAQTLAFQVADVDNSSVTYDIAVDGTSVQTGTVAVPGTVSLTHNFTNAHTVVVTVNDGKLSNSCSTTVTVSDTEAPKIACPENITVGNDPGQCSAVVNFAATASDNCGSANVTYSIAPGSVFPVGTTSVTATATDGSGNASSCTFTVTVKDTEAPAVACPGNIAVNTTPGQCSAVVSYSATATDNCGTANVTYSIAPGSAFAVGSTTVTVTATDSSGNSSTCTFNVTVTDNEAPTIACPADIAVGTDLGQCSAVVSYSATAGDNCGATVSYSIAPGSVFPVGTTTVTATATDAAGNSTSCSFTVTVKDTEAPKIACPANITVGNDPDLCSAVVSYTATATDNCGATVSYSIAPGSVFPVGTTTVTATATDAAGNQSSCSFTVTVNDSQAPTGTCVPTTNPSGNNEPGGKSNGKNGQNPDGFYQLLGGDNCTATSALQLYVKDSASSFVAGPFKHGDKVKITQAPGVTPNSKPMSGVIVAHIQLKGDALLVVVDSSGNSSTVASCLVPPLPK